MYENCEQSLVVLQICFVRKILKPSVFGRRDRVLNSRILKLLRSPWIDSSESILPAYVARRTGTITLFLLRFLSPMEYIKIPAQVCSYLSHLRHVPLLYFLKSNLSQKCLTSFVQWLHAIEEGRTARKVLIKNLAIYSFYFPASSFCISKNSAVDKIMQYLNYEYWNKHTYSTRKVFEECVREPI